MSSTNDALDAAVADSLALEWSPGHGRFTMTRHDLGTNSRTWLITAGDERWVAKAVPLARRFGIRGRPSGRSARRGGGHPCLSLRPWIRPAVADGVAGYDALGPDTLTAGPLHTDPAPEAFRLDAETGICGSIDWDNVLVGAVAGRPGLRRALRRRAGAGRSTHRGVPGRACDGSR